MSDEFNRVEVAFQGEQIQYDQDLMNAMWNPNGLLAHPVQDTYSFYYEREQYGIVDLLCYLDTIRPELREKGPEAIIESVLELITSVYIGNEDLMLIGRVIDLYGIERQDRVGVVFRTLVIDGRKEVDDILAIREVARDIFPVPEPTE